MSHQFEATITTFFYLTDEEYEQAKEDSQGYRSLEKYLADDSAIWWEDATRWGVERIDIDYLGETTT